MTFLCCFDTIFAIWVSWSPVIKAFGSNVSPVHPEDLHFFPINWNSEDFTDEEMTADLPPPPKKKS